MAFTREWSEECSEEAEAKGFRDAFFHVFGIHRRRVASFEVPVNKADGRGGFIDLLWKGMLLVEHKSRGRDLDRSFRQAFDYFLGIKDRDLPRIPPALSTKTFPGACHSPHAMPISVSTYKAGGSQKTC